MRSHISLPEEAVGKWTVRKVVLLGTVLVLMCALGIPVQEVGKSPVKITEMILDIASFNAAIVGYSLMSSGYSSGVGLELKRNGELGRGVKEFLRFWDYEYSIPSQKMAFKKKNLLIAHPLMGYQFSNYLLAKGYTRKRALLTTGLGVYLLEKGIQGSFETPSAYDLLSYVTGAVISVLVHDSVDKLYHKHFLLKPVALAVNPFVLFDEN